MMYTSTLHNLPAINALDKALTWLRTGQSMSQEFILNEVPEHHVLVKHFVKYIVYSRINRCVGQGPP